MRGLERKISETDRWVFSVATVLAIVLIVASVVTGNVIYLGYLSGIAFLVFMYFLFAR